MNRILVIEDDARVAKALRIRLKHIGFAVDVASDAQRGYRLIERRRPDLILMDVMLSGEDGLSATGHLQRRLETMDIPVVIVTASRRPGIGRRVRQCGAVALLRKPYTSHELRAIIDEVLRENPYGIYAV